MKRPVWFDTDVGIDDAIALLVLGQLEDVEVKGVSAVAGNVELEYTYPNTRNVCAFAGLPYPVYKGAEKPLFQPLHTAHEIHGPEGLGSAKLPQSQAPQTEKNAWDALYEAAVEAKGELELIAVGPLTNVAIALGKYPQLRTLLRRIVIMGGSATMGNTTPAAEFNIFVDPHAAQMVFKSGIPLVMCGLDVTMKAQMTFAEIEALGAEDSRICRFFGDCTRDARKIYEMAGIPGICLHDVCAVLYGSCPELFRGQEAGVYVETQGTVTKGKTVTDLWSDKKFEKKNAFVVLDVDRPAFAAKIAELLRRY